jgi:hypothetical protein
MGLFDWSTSKTQANTTVSVDSSSRINQTGLMSGDVSALLQNVTQNAYLSNIYSQNALVSMARVLGANSGNGGITASTGLSANFTMPLIVAVISGLLLMKLSKKGK